MQRGLAALRTFGNTGGANDFSVVLFNADPYATNNPGRIWGNINFANVAFAIDNAPAGQPGGPKKGCGKSGAKKFTYSSLFILIGLTFAWRRSRARRKNDGTRKKG
jgi:hypothetical protein